MNKKPINLESNELKRLMNCFPKSFINSDNELILVPGINLFLDLNTIYTDFDLKYRVLSACSRSCVPEKCKSKYWAKTTRQSTNEFLEVGFGDGDYRLLYDKFGGRTNEEEGRRFVEEDMDITQFDEWGKGVFKNTTLDDCIGNFQKTKNHLKELKVIPERTKNNEKWYEREKKIEDKYTLTVRNFSGEIVELIKPLKMLKKLMKIDLEDFLKLEVIECDTERQWLTLYAYLTEKGHKREDGTELDTAPWIDKGWSQYAFLKDRTWDYSNNDQEYTNLMDVFDVLKKKGKK